MSQKNYEVVGNIIFPKFGGIRCTMMPFIQGDSSSIPDEYSAYADIIDNNVVEGQRGEIGYLTIHESFVDAGQSQRGFGSGRRKIHTEGCKRDTTVCWGAGWGSNSRVELENDLKVIIANSVDNSCAVWDSYHEDITEDGDLYHFSEKYTIEKGYLMKAGELVNIGIRTPHECIDQKYSGNRQFFRIVGSGVHGREDYFTINPLMKAA